MPLPSDRVAGRSSRPGRIARRVGLGAALAVAVALLLGLALYAGWPWLAEVAAPRLAWAAGLDALELESRRPGLRGLRLPRLHARRGNVEVRAEKVWLGFDVAGLAAGRVAAVAVDTLTVTLLDRDVDAAGSAPAALPAEPRRPADLLAALPVDRVRVDALVVAAPALDFQGAGRLALNDAGLDLSLAATGRDRARGLALNATLSRQGLIEAHLTDTTTEGDDLLAVTSEVRQQTDGPGRLGIQGRLDLRGPALGLLAAAGLPDGVGRVRGEFEASLPWPVPREPDWAVVDGRGSLNVTGRFDGAGWRLEAAALDWQLAGGRLSGTAGLAAQVASGRWDVDVDVAEWRLPDAGGSGAVRVRPADTGTLVVDGAWRAAGGALAVDGAVDVSRAVLDALGVGPAAGSGHVRIDFSGRLQGRLQGRSVAGLAGTAEGSVSGAWSVPAPGLEFRDVEGRWRLDQRTLSGHLQAVGGWQDLATKVRASLTEMTLAAGGTTARGELALGDTAPVSFDLVDGPESARLRLDGRLEAAPALLDRALTGWTVESDVTAGTIVLDMDLQWPDPGAPGSSILVDLDDVRAHYGEYAVSGLSATLRLEAEPAGWRLTPADVAVAGVATGVAVTALRSGVAWAGDVVHVQPTRFELLGGTGTVPAFDYQVTAGRARMPLTLDGLDLARILALEGGQISGTGRIDGTLPVAIDDHRPSISGGMVRAAPPGGRLQVSPTLAGGTGQPGLDFALRALQDFRYAVLQADVDYDADGNLGLAVHLEGRNPDIEGGRPIHYNVNVTENVPVLLRSLRLEGEVTRSLERRLNN